MPNTLKAFWGHKSCHVPEDFVLLNEIGCDAEGEDWRMETVPGGVLDVLYVCHELEKMDHMSAVLFLAECARLLKPDGVLVVSTFDMRFLAKMYIENPDADLRTLVCGLETDGVPHRSWWDYNSLSRELWAQGLTAIERVVPIIYLGLEPEYRDKSGTRACGEFVSLNVKAERKGQNG